MRKVLTIAGAALAALLLLAAVYLARLVRSLDTPEFKQALLERARVAVGAEVRAGELKVSLLRGVTMAGVAVANPPGFPGQLLSADAFRLHYDLWPLLRGRLQVDELVLQRPTLLLAMDARGTFNYERLAPAASARPDARLTGMATLPLELRLSKLAVENAQVQVVDHRRAPILALSDLDLDSAFTVSAGTARGGGQARIDTLRLVDRLSLQRVSAPIELARDRARFAPIRATLAAGDASGSLEIGLAPDFRYTLQLQVEGANVETLLREAGSSGLSGSLAAKGSFEGAGGLPTLAGSGSAHVADCRVRGSKVLAILAAALQLPELASPDFEECRAEFALARGRAETRVLSLKGPSVQLGGRGTSNLTTGALDYDMTLALHQALLGRLPIKEVRAAFSERGDSFSTLDFKVSGTTDAPRTDVAARIARAGATEVLKGALQKLFGRKKTQP
jgi:uncharacterized protein involved in outer membrane biogenesis